MNRVEYVGITDDEALEAFHNCCLPGRDHPRAGNRPRPGRSHVSARPNLRDDHLMVVYLSGRGDKDMQTVMSHMDAAEDTQEKLV